MSMIEINGWAFIALVMALVSLAINLSMRGK